MCLVPLPTKCIYTKMCNIFTDIDDCAGNPCMNGASCTDLVNDYMCSCIAGYGGSNCERNVSKL